MSIGLLTILIHIPGCVSLKEKRQRLKPLVTRLHREFNVSVAEIDHHDIWQSSLVGCTLISNDVNHVHQSLLQILKWVAVNRPDLEIMDDHIEIIQ